MEKLAKCGDGNAYYMDDETEAKRIFKDRFGALVNTVAKDTKAKITFNSEMVDKYRVIGYENNNLTEDEYESEYTDAGEISLGFSTIALYELVLNEEFESINVLDLEVKYLDVDKNENVLFTSKLESLNNASNDFIFASCVAEFGLILRQSVYMGDASFENLISRLNICDLGNDEEKLEFKELVGLASELDMFKPVYKD
jgi:Ca-activated chloride channel family protein